MKAVVITPTVGEPTLLNAIQSVANQTVTARHLIVVDGSQYLNRVKDIVDSCSTSTNIELLTLPRSTGEGGYFGHRAIASAAFTTVEDAIFMLDSDNLFRPTHIEVCLDALQESGADWCYSMREIVDDQGNFLLEDDGESVGFWPRAMYYQAHRGWHTPFETDFVNRYPFLVDTSCFCIKRDSFIRYSWAWDNGHGADAIFAKLLVENVSGVGTGLTTVSYRLSAEKALILTNHFRTCNQTMVAIYGCELPWRRREGAFVRAPAGDQPTQKRLP